MRPVIEILIVYAAAMFAVKDLPWLSVILLVLGAVMICIEMWRDWSDYGWGFGDKGLPSWKRKTKKGEE